MTQPEPLQVYSTAITQQSTTSTERWIAHFTTEGYLMS